MIRHSKYHSSTSTPGATRSFQPRSARCLPLRYAASAPSQRLVCSPCCCPVKGFGVTAPLSRLRILSEGQSPWLSSSPGHAGASLITFMFVRSATPHLSVAAEQQSRQPDDVGGYALHRRSTPLLFLEIDVRQRLPVGVADDEAGGVHRPVQESKVNRASMVTVWSRSCADRSPLDSRRHREASQSRSIEVRRPAISRSAAAGEGRMDRIYSGVRPMVRTRSALFCLLVGLLGGSPRRDTARRCR
jgi:hypothetical protein